MALTSTIYTFEIDLADMDRGVYETLSLKVAQHPSESEEFLVARVLAYCLEYTDGISFSRGLCDPDEPAIAVRDLTGRLDVWIDVGTPAVERLHRAGKMAPRVAVYVHKEHRQWLPALRAATIHRRDALQVRLIDPPLIRELVARLDRRMSMAISVTDAEVTVSFADGTLTGTVSSLQA